MPDRRVERRARIGVTKGKVAAPDPLLSGQEARSSEASTRDSLKRQRAFGPEWSLRPPSSSA